MSHQKNWERALEAREQQLNDYERTLELRDSRLAKLEAELLDREARLNCQHSSPELLRGEFEIQRIPLEWVWGMRVEPYACIEPPFVRAVIDGAMGPVYLVDPNVPHHSNPGIVKYKRIAHAYKPHRLALPVWDSGWFWYTFLPKPESLCVQSLEQTAKLIHDTFMYDDEDLLVEIEQLQVMHNWLLKLQIHAFQNGKG